MNASTFRRLRAVAAKSPLTLVCQVSTSFAGASLVLALALLVAATTPQSASAQTVTYAGSGAVNFGAANVCPSGKTSPPPCSQTRTLTYNVTESGTLGTPQALTTGAPNLDYKLASGSTCVGSVTKGNTCTVNVTFAPIAPGARNGAVEIVNASGNVLATTFIYGTGTGPAAAFFTPGASVQFGSGLEQPQSLAVDASGNVFVSSFDNGELKEILAAGGYATTITFGGFFTEPYGVAVDGAGNVFVANVWDLYPSKPSVQEVLRAGGYTTVKSLGSGFTFPTAVSVDGSGNVFVVDFGVLKEILEAGGYTTVKTLASNFNANGLAVDGSGNLFATANNAVEEVTAASGYTTIKTLHSGFTSPSGIAVDASDNVYVADVQTNSIFEVLAAGDYATVVTLGNNFNGPTGVAVDAAGNVYICGTGGNQISPVTELPRAQPPSFAFPSTIVGTSSSPQSTTLQNIGNTDLVDTSLSVSPNWEQVAGSGTPADCAAGFSLVPGAECNLSIIFEPTESGNLTGAVALTDNALNGTDATQSIALSGAAGTLEITSLNTTYGAPYSVVIVNGTNFQATQGSSTVTFNGIATPHYAWSNTQIYVTVPPNATSGNVVVHVAGKTSNAVPFTVVAQPTVTGISPDNGNTGTVVTISGTNLLDYGNKATVTFSGKSLPILSQSSAALTVAVPSGSVTGVFHVIVNDTGLNTPTFIVGPAVAFTGSSSVNFGTANVCPSGKTVPAPCSQTLSLTYNITGSGTLGTPLALTTGAPDLDYKLASGSTCTGSITVGNTCTVNVAFAPIAPGQRHGAVEIVDTTGRVLATTYIYGEGVGPLAGLVTPYQIPVVVAHAPYGFNIAVDASGDLFTAVNGTPNGVVQEVLAVNGTIPPNPVVKVLNDQYNPFIVAVDGAGNVFFTTYPDQTLSPTASVVEILAAGGYKTTKVLATGFTYLQSIAVDDFGDVFVGDVGSGYGKNIALYELPAAGGYTTKKTIGGGFKFYGPIAIAVDGSENVFVVDAAPVGNSAYGVIDELTAAAGYNTVRTIHANVLNEEYTNLGGGIAIDPAGNLYFIISNTIGEALAVDGVVPSNPVIQYFGNFYFSPDGDVPPQSIALDSRGNIFAPDNGINSPGAGIVELQFSPPAALSFLPTYVGQTSSDSPQSYQIQNRGNATLKGTAISVTSNWDRVAGSGTPADCAASFSLAPAAECNISVDFEPTAAGYLTGHVAIVDNSLNASGSTQYGPLNGEGITVPPPQITYLTPNYGAPGSQVQVIGTNFGSSQGSSTVTFNGIPAAVTHWYPTNILATVPSNVATGEVASVMVTVDGEKSDSLGFTVVATPTITGISPTSGTVGTLVTISGTNLTNYEGVEVDFDNYAFSLDIRSETNTAIQVNIPPGAVTGTFNVFVNGFSFTTPTFTVTQ